MLGLISAGSGVFIVIYSSCTAFTAIFSRVFLHRKLRGLQWLAIALVCAGLATSYFGVSHAPGAETASSSMRTLFGVFFSLLGSFLHSAVFVLTDAFLSSNTHTKSWQLCSYVGRTEVAGLLLWNACGYAYASTHGGSWFHLSDAAWSADAVPVTLCLFGALWAVNCLHAACFFDLIGAIGSVSAAVLKGVQTVSVYALSALLFCQYQQSQCFTPVKALSMVIVVVGTSLYSLSKPKAAAAPAACVCAVEGADAASPACDDEAAGGEDAPLRPSPRDSPVPTSSDGDLGPGERPEEETTVLIVR